MNDDPTGHNRAPNRYSAQGRETIDRIRDELGDTGFVMFCLGNARKYADRAGLKGDAAEDYAKERWYRDMALHVVGEAVDDPRFEREGFVPYERSAGPGDGQLFWVMRQIGRRR